MRHDTRPGRCARYVSSSNSFGVSRTSLPSTSTRNRSRSITSVAADDRFARRCRRVDPPQRDANPREQFLGAERLGDVVVGAGIERPHLVVFRAARRQHDDRRAPALANLAADVDAVDVGEARDRG